MAVPTFSFGGDNEKLGVQFEIGYLFSTAKGSFQDVQVDIKLNLEKPDECFVNAVVTTQTIKMRSSTMENFVKTESFFDVEHFPTMSFKLTKIRPFGEKLKAYGILQIKDVIKNIEIPFTIQKKNGSKFLCSSFTIDRTSYHIGKSIPGLDDEVVIQLRLPI